MVPLGGAIFQGIAGSVNLLPLAVSLAVSVMVLLCAAGVPSLRACVLRKRAFALLSLGCGTLGAALVLLGASTGSLTVLLAGSVLVGVYEAVGIMVSGSIATCQGTTNALIHIAVALPLNIIPIVLVAFLRPEAAVVLASILPLLSALSYAVYQVRGTNEQRVKGVLKANRVRKHPASLRVFLREQGGFLAMVLVITMGFGIVNVRATLATGQSPFDEYLGLLIRAAASAVVLFGYLRFSWNPRHVFNVAVVVMAVSLVGLAVVPGPLFDWVFMGMYLCFDLLIWAIIIGPSYATDMPLLRTVCLVQGVDQFGIFLGTADALGMTSGSALLAVAAFLGVAALLLMMGLLLRKRSPIEELEQADFGWSERDAAPTECETAAATVPSQGGEEAGVKGSAAATVAEGAGDVSVPGKAGVEEASPASADAGAASSASTLQELAGRYFLSDREVDILELLMAGRSGPYIADSLCISINTAKTHIRHIYTKLDVHNRQELLDLLHEMQL